MSTFTTCNLLKTDCNGFLKSQVLRMKVLFLNNNRLEIDVLGRTALCLWQNTWKNPHEGRRMHQNSQGAVHANAETSGLKDMQDESSSLCGNREMGYSGGFMLLAFCSSMSQRLLDDVSYLQGLCTSTMCCVTWRSPWNQPHISTHKCALLIPWEVLKKIN